MNLVGFVANKIRSTCLAGAFVNMLHNKIFLIIRVKKYDIKKPHSKERGFWWEQQGSNL